MTTNDLIITPFFIILVFIIASVVRPYFTDQHSKKYFLPALGVKVFGALAVGMIYQFYYSGGDTFNFHTHGSVHIWEAMIENPVNGIKLLLDNGRDNYSVFQYASKIWYYGDKPGYSVVKLAAVFDLFTFATYSATAVLFATLSFSGMWVLFLTFYQQYPKYVKGLALGILFMPSVFFWGSGIFKDTVVLAAMGWAIWSFYRIFISFKRPYLYPVLLLISLYIIYVIKIYVLLILLPSLLIWVTREKLTLVKPAMLRYMVTPLVFALAGVVAFYTINRVSEDSRRYRLDRIAETAKITAYDIRYGWGARTGEGSGYTLGELDGTFTSMLRLAPSAVNVALFRPYIFEVRNPLMLLAAVESAFLLIFTLYVVFRLFMRRYLKALFEPSVVFSFVFSVVFAFAVGISTFNFGTLSRYKLPLVPLFIAALVILFYKTKRSRKSDLTESVE